jgi:uncharacterized protein YxjI
VRFPLTLSFKIIALASQIYVRDAGGRDLLYVHQKLLKLKESITVYADATKAKALYRIAADRVIDFRARYDFTDAAGGHLGAVKRQGARSLWRATYDIYLDAGDSAHLRIREERPWVKFLDGLLGEIPIFGIFTGYFLNPTYQVVDTATGELAYRVVKRRALLESRFVVDRHAGAPTRAAERAVLLAILTVTLLERSRG